MFTQPIYIIERWPQICILLLNISVTTKRNDRHDWLFGVFSSLLQLATKPRLVSIWSSLYSTILRIFVKIQESMTQIVPSVDDN
jgi:hypothetical protein